MTYLNNAATSYPKPPAVVAAMTEALLSEPASSLRSTLSAGMPPEEHLRTKLAELLDTPHIEDIHLTSGATDSLNRLIAGISPMLAAVTGDNHNSVLRPVSNHKGVQRILIGEPSQLEMLSHIDWLILPHCDNVTGHIHDIAQVCRMAHGKGVKVLVDAAQSLGTVPFHTEDWDVDAVAFTGHKGLLGPQGIGGYYLRRGIPLRPTLFGGTGRDSSIVTYDEGDWEYEVGTPNGPGIAGLAAGVDYVLGHGVEAISNDLRNATNWLIAELSLLPGVTCYSHGGDDQGPVVSFNVAGLHPSDVGYILQNEYGITVRTGLHCAPLSHKMLGTLPHGTVRVSLSVFNTHEDLALLLHALRDITAAL